jgi:hypothetical protein
MLFWMGVGVAKGLLKEEKQVWHFKEAPEGTLKPKTVSEENKKYKTRAHPPNLIDTPVQETLLPMTHGCKEAFGTWLELGRNQSLPRITLLPKSDFKWTSEGSPYSQEGF